jgi:glucose/arabinose dehydrogenase
VRRSRSLSLALALALAGASAPRTARAVLDTEGFRAVAVAQTPYPISAMAVAPDGRLFSAVQELGQTTDPDPGTAEIRVFSSYKTTDGSTLDTGSVWATVDGIRATNMEEGLLGIALAPDFASSKLVYVYLTTTDEEVTQQTARATSSAP